jgi:histidine triad (HIT) family protein
MECIFCQIAAGTAPNYRLAESEDFVAFLSIFPAVAGHTVVIPKKHTENLLDFPSEHGTELVGFLQKVARAVLKGVDAQGCNFALNNGSAAGQEVLHTHFHIVPRKHGDGLHAPFEGKKGVPEELSAVQVKIRTFLDV